jgi:hypothetical protein
MGLKWLVPLIGPLDLIGMWFGEDQRTDIIITYVQKRSDYFYNINNYSTLNSEHNHEDMYPTKKLTNMHFR